METTTVKLYSLDYSNVKTYWAASLFIIGNILFPKLFHLIPQGGITWLPIYFFTLIGAYKYGWKVGLLTAVLSPAINSLLFSMPAPATLPVILLKSVLLAIAAGWTAQHFRRISVIMLIGVVFAYQVAGTLENGYTLVIFIMLSRISALEFPGCVCKYSEVIFSLSI